MRLFVRIGALFLGIPLLAYKGTTFRHINQIIRVKQS